MAMSVNAYLERVAPFLREVLEVIDGRMPLLLGELPRGQWFATVLLARACHYYFAACRLYPNYAEPCAGVCRVVIEMADKIHYHIRECGSDGYDGFRMLNMPHRDIRRKIYEPQIAKTYAEYYGDLSNPLHGGDWELYHVDGRLIAGHTESPKGHMYAAYRMVDAGARLVIASDAVMDFLGKPQGSGSSLIQDYATALIKIGNETMEDLMGRLLPTYGDPTRGKEGTEE